MSKGKLVSLIAYILLLSLVVACSTTTTPALPTSPPVPTSAPPQPTATTLAPAPTTAPTRTATAVTKSPTAPVTVVNRKDHDDASDYVWNASQVVRIALQGNAITATGAGVTVNGNKVKITTPGTYSISGSLTDGQIVVDTTAKGVVRLILNGVEIHHATSAPIYVMNAEKTMIVLVDNTKNIVSDGKEYAQATKDDEPNATIFSKGDLTIFGNGSLSVNANYSDGIASKDGLVIKSGTLAVHAVDDGIRGRDYVVVKNGHVTIIAQGDGFKSGNEEDPGRGYVSIENGVVNITAGGDAIQAQTNATITNGKITLTSGGGSKGSIAATASAKGIKAGANVTIGGGNFAISSADDGIHSNDSIVINGGTFAITTGDDAIHADANVKINGGNIRITESYEGIESAVVTINGGEIYVVSLDDGLNGAGGRDASGMNPGPGVGRVPGGPPPPGRDGFVTSSKYFLYINGGYIVVDASGDGIDINGSIEMTNGVVIVNGPTTRFNSAVDFDGSFKMTGGFLIGVGSSNMAQAPGDTSTQHALLLNLTSTQRAGSLVHIQSTDGKGVLTFLPTKDYQSIAFSSAGLALGMTYDVYFGGSATGTAKDGLYQGGAHSGGVKNTSFTISSMVTRIGVTRFR